ncbi:C1 domain containing protein [Oryctes borbonicus]|uniref:C1 domain containing protein n=1 Tax=Oryctes borbonicus TaxID=1629725 RepID=A0A0T6B434_9SCAR|nr:C1 domain containing protein [Oryctes borbonicus]
MLIQLRVNEICTRQADYLSRANLNERDDELDQKLSAQVTLVELNLYASTQKMKKLKKKELFSNKMDTGETGRERKNSSSSTASMKTKWLKALKSLKTPPPEEKKNGSAATRELLKGDPDAHNFQEYTYKKITPCDVCSQVLRGHTRQGLKCRICKMNVHVDCQEKAPKCETKARLLRRQKSTSEIETRIPDASAEEESLGFDESYSRMPTMNRQLSVKNDRLPNPADLPIDRRHAQGPSTSDSSMRRRLFAGMKSLTGFGSRSRQGSPGHRSISLPEKRNSQDGSGNRPFGQPLCLGPSLENGGDVENSLPPTPPSPSPSKAKLNLQYKKNAKQKK